jgi:hypothetical protein
VTDLRIDDNTEEDAKAPVLLSVNVGMPADVSWQGKTVYTGVWKRPVDGPVMARRMNIDGDGQGDPPGRRIGSRGRRAAW